MQRETGKLHILDPLWSAVGRQLRFPAGRWGRLTGHLMGVVNAQPNKLAIDALAIAPQDTILELGFGPGKAIKVLAGLASGGRVMGIDQSTEMLKQASHRNRQAIHRGHVSLELGHFDHLELPSASIDKLLAVNVAYFFKSDGSNITEARRVLRPGGRMVIYVAEKASMSGWKFAGPDSHRLYDQASLQALLLRGGFNHADIKIHRLKLAFGITGLLAVANKPFPVRQNSF